MPLDLDPQDDFHTPEELDDRLATRHAMRDIAFEPSAEPVSVIGPNGRSKLVAHPYGVSTDPDGVVRTQVVVPIRVTTPLADSPETVAAMRAWQRRVYPVIAGAVILGVIAAVGITALFQRPVVASTTVPPGAAAVPCLVSRLDAGGVVCRIGADETTVAPGQFFADGSKRLESIDREASSFVVTYIPTNTKINFQVDARVLTPAAANLPETGK